jgi:hypothetical protein
MIPRVIQGIANETHDLINSFCLSPPNKAYFFGQTLVFPADARKGAGSSFRNELYK